MASVHSFDIAYVAGTWIPFLTTKMYNYFAYSGAAAIPSLFAGIRVIRFGYSARDI